MKNLIKELYNREELVMKKSFALMCSTLMLASAFTGCASKEESTSAEVPKETVKEVEKEAPAAEANEDKKLEGELNIAVFEGGYGKAYWEAIKTEFEKDYPGTTINITANPKIGEIIRPQILAGNTPDFIYLSSSDSSGVPQALIKDKALLDLTEVFNEEVPGEGVLLKDKVLDGFLETTGVAPYGDGSIYLAPLYYDVTGLYYNKKLFTDNGWDVPQTWDEFYTLGDQAKEKGTALFTYQGIHPGYNDGTIFATMATAGGPEALQNAFNYVDGAWESDAVKKMAGVYETIGTKGYLMEGTVGLNHTQAQTEFLKGNALFIPCGNWLESEMQDVVPDGFEFGFMAPPAFEAGQTRYVNTSVQQMYIPAGAKNPELAKEFLKYQYTDKAVALNAEHAKAVVAVEGSVEMAKEYIPESAYETFNVFNDQIKPVMGSWLTTEQTEMSIGDALFNPIGEVVTGKKSGEEWVSEVEVVADKLRDIVIK